MKLSQFQFPLTNDKIALYPPRWRDECKLMVLHKDSGEIEHTIFKNIIDYFGKGDTFVLNNTRVFPAMLRGNKEKTGADIGVFLLRELNREQRLWDVIVDPYRLDFYRPRPKRRTWRQDCGHQRLRTGYLPDRVFTD